jgi:ferric-dicitrate binding protein FerR (iron transport regulator)
MMTKPAEPEPKPAEEIAGWRSNKLIFQEKPISVIFNELERRYDVQIDLEVAGAESEVISAYYTSPQSIDAILEDISTVKGFRYAETANGYRIFK